MLQTLRSAARTGLLGLGAFALAPLASAAIVTGNWDPALPDPPFDNLGWTATINLKVDNRCTEGAQSLPLITNIFILGRSFGCRTSPLAPTMEFSILSAEVGLYDLTTQRITKVLTFDPTSFLPRFLDLGANGAITYLFSALDSNIVSWDGFDFRLSLPGAAPALSYRQGSTGGFTGTDTPRETSFALNLDDSAQTAILDATRLREGDLVFTGTVPEPGSLALALGAASAAASRRRAAQAAA